MPRWRRSRTGRGELTIATSDGTVVARIPEETRDEIQYLLARQDLHEGGLAHSLAVTSAQSGEGVSFISYAVAAVLSADVGRRSCLIRANFWGEIDHFDESAAGLADVFRGDATLDDVVMRTRYPQLSLIPSGVLDEPLRTILPTAERMRFVLDSLRDHFDHLILDLPAISTSSASLSLASEADASLLVARQRASSAEQVERAVADLRHTRLLGIVLNDHRLSLPDPLQRWLLDA